MNREDFGYIKCTKCGKVHIVPVSYKYEYAALDKMCTAYNKLMTCCNKPIHNFCSIEYGLLYGYIRESDLPEVLRDKVNVEFENNCGNKRMVVTKGDKKTVIEVDKEYIYIRKNNILTPSIRLF